MSATRDKSQKVTFVFSNFYQLYKKGKDAAVRSNPGAAGTPPPFDPSRHVLKAHDANVSGLNVSSPLSSEPLVVREHRPAELLAKRIAKPPVLKPSTAIVTLRENLKSLTDLHSRLKFMLEELEDLVK
jgi:hypothetical protein